MNIPTEKTGTFIPRRTDGAIERCKELCSTEGHPLQIFSKENEAIAQQLQRLQVMLGENAVDETAKDMGQFSVSRGNLQETENHPPISRTAPLLSALDGIRQVTIHYAKKGDLLYPLIKTKYGYKGPSDGLWTADDEIRDDLKNLVLKAQKDPEVTQTGPWREELSAVLERIRDMMVRENNVVFPLCARIFSEEEWQGIARDLQDYEMCLIPPQPLWAKAAQKPAVSSVRKTDKPGTDVNNPDADNSDAGISDSAEVVFPTGHMTARQLDAMLNTLPMELTFIDENSINRYYNDGPDTKLFKRPLASLDREVFSCHPPKIEPMVRRIIEEFKSGARDMVEIWNSRNGEPVLIRYMAVRDKTGTYVGTLECVQKMGFAKKKFEEMK